MTKKLYVGNLPYAIDDNQLKELFAGYGEIASANVIFDKFSGRSKGFGFVEFSDGEAADKAVEELDGKDIEGRNIRVNEARPKEPRSNNRGGGGGFGGGGFGGGRRGGGDRGGYGDQDRRGGGNRW